MDAWIENEISDVNLGDGRLNQRYALLLERLQDKPSLSIPGACNGWAETQAAYPYFAGIITGNDLCVTMSPMGESKISHKSYC